MVETNFEFDRVFNSKFEISLLKKFDIIALDLKNRINSGIDENLN